MLQSCSVKYSAVQYLAALSVRCIRSRSSTFPGLWGPCVEAPSCPNSYTTMVHRRTRSARLQRSCRLVCVYGLLRGREVEAEGRRGAVGRAYRAPRLIACSHPSSAPSLDKKDIQYKAVVHT